MHDLIQEFGQHIVRQESKDPGKRSRLWLYNDVCRVLMNNTGTEAVESIVLQPSEKKELLNLGAEAFAKMTELRLLKICNVRFPNGLEYLSNKLRYLDWDGYPLKCTPLTFRPTHLVELRLSNSCIEQLWDGKLPLHNLRVMYFRNLRNLTKCPDFTDAPKLESLIFENCKSLVDVHQSVGALAKLRELLIEGCMNLRSLPTSLDGESLEHLVVREGSKNFNFPKIWGNLTSLECLILSGCPDLMNFTDIFGNMKCSADLQLQSIDIMELALSVGHLDNLVTLSLNHCQNLISLPDSICQPKALKYINLDECSKLEKLPAGINQLSKLYTLSLRGCKRLEELPEVPPALRKIYASDCQSLRTVSLSPYTNEESIRFDFSNCVSLLEKERILDALLSTAQVRTYGGGSEIIFPVSEIPEWFSRDKVELPSNNRRGWEYAACAVVEIEEIEVTHEPGTCIVCGCHCLGAEGHLFDAQLNIEDRISTVLDTDTWWRPGHTGNLWIKFGRIEGDGVKKLSGSEFATFTITPVSSSRGFKIKTCGLRLWSLEEEEEEEDNEPIAMDLDLNKEETVGPSGSRSLDEEEEDPSMDLQVRI